MPDYEKLYHIMFNAVTDAIELLPDCAAKMLLIETQQECEERYINNDIQSNADV